jgi:hypothetical protein
MRGVFVSAGLARDVMRGEVVFRPSRIWDFALRWMGFTNKKWDSFLMTAGNVLARRDEREGLDHPRCWRWLNVFTVTRSSAILSFVHPSA